VVIHIDVQADHISNLELETILCHVASNFGKRQLAFVTDESNQFAISSPFKMNVIVTVETNG
jgi:hypothetical protein